MRLKIQVIALSGMLAFGLSAGFAQSGTMEQSAPPPMHGEGMGHRGPMSPDQQLAHLTERLSLTSDQQAKIKPILESRRDSMMQLHQDSSLSRDAKMEKMRSLDESSRSQIEAILNDQQKAKFAQMHDRAEHEHGMHQGGAEGAAQPQK